MTTNVLGNHQAVAPPQQDRGSATARIRDFIRMSSPEFFGLVAGEDPYLYQEEGEEDHPDYAYF